MIPNPEYFGKWQPKLIKNPDYKGEWKQPMIPNPNFISEDLEAYIRCVECNYVGIEVWQNTAGTIFDDIMISDSYDDVLASWKVWGMKLLTHTNIYMLYIVCACVDVLSHFSVYLLSFYSEKAQIRTFDV